MTHRLLLVDDDPNLRLALRRVLEGFGVSVILAGSASQALHLLEVSSFDAVLSDYDLGSGSQTGVQLLRQVPEGLKRQLMTGNPDAVEEGWSGVTERIWCKPIEVTTIIAWLDS